MANKSTKDRVLEVLDTTGVVRVASSPHFWYILVLVILVGVVGYMYQYKAKWEEAKNTVDILGAGKLDPLQVNTMIDKYFKSTGKGSASSYTKGESEDLNNSIQSARDNRVPDKQSVFSADKLTQKDIDTTEKSFKDYAKMTGKDVVIREDGFVVPKAQFGDYKSLSELDPKFESAAVFNYFGIESPRKKLDWTIGPTIMYKSKGDTHFAAGGRFDKVEKYSVDLSIDSDKKGFNTMVYFPIFKKYK